MQPKEPAVYGQAQDSGEQNVCARCPRRRLCEHLADAMAVIRMHPSVLVDLHLVRARNTLQKSLDLLEFAYPSSLEFCQFSQIHPNEARRMLFRARDLAVAWTVNEEQDAH